MTDKIKLLEQWRDWYWQAMIYHDAKNTGFAIIYQDCADLMDKAIRILHGENIPTPSPIEGYEQYKYGEWPE